MRKQIQEGFPTRLLLTDAIWVLGHQLHDLGGQAVVAREHHVLNGGFRDGASLGGWPWARGCRHPPPWRRRG